MKNSKKKTVSLKKMESIEYKSRKKAFFSTFNFTLLTVIAMIGLCIFISVFVDSNQAKEIRKIYRETEYASLYVDDSVSASFENKMVEFLKGLPADLQSKIHNDWTIVVCDTMPDALAKITKGPATNYDISNLINGGMTYYQKRVVYVNSSLSGDMSYTSFVHEIGHLVSFERNCAHGCSEWVKIYKDTSDIYVCEGYYASNSAEYFANAFMEYYLLSDKIQENAPEMYSYMDEVINGTPVKGLYGMFLTGKNTLMTYYYMYSGK